MTEPAKISRCEREDRIGNRLSINIPMRRPTCSFDIALQTAVNHQQLDNREEKLTHGKTDGQHVRGLRGLWGMARQSVHDAFSSDGQPKGVASLSVHARAMRGVPS